MSEQFNQLELPGRWIAGTRFSPWKAQKTIKEFLSENYEYSSINQANSHKGIYFIDYNTPYEVRIEFIPIGKEFFVRVANQDRIKLF